MEEKPNVFRTFFTKLWSNIKKGFQKCRATLRGLFGKKAPEADQPEATVLFNSKKMQGTSPASVSLPEKWEKLFQPKQREPFFLLGMLLTTLKILGICLVMVMIAAVGAVFGVGKAYLGTTPELDLVEISNNDLTSYIYDCNGNLITTYAGVENRDYATIDEIPLHLQQAVVAIEDTRFYSHHGVDLKGLMNAFLGNLTSNSVSGGSTITQQLIKNKLLTTEKSYKRKIQEMSLALQLEKVYTKDQILEAYLNSMPLGGTNYGVKAAALDYFGKSLDELTLRECACLAGVTQFPWLYSPRRAMYVTNKMDQLNDRINTVLRRMYQSGYITKEEMEEARADDLVVLEHSVVSDLYAMPHFVEYAIYDVVTHLLKVRELEDTTANRNAISNELRTGGYHIYTTVDPDIQNTVQQTLSEAKYPRMSEANRVIVHSDGSETIQPQAAAVVLDQHTGELKAIVGSRNEPTTQKSLNRAYQSRMPVGSSIKPITVYGPAFDAGCGLGTIIENIPVAIPGWGTAAGHPTTSVGTYGPTTIRTGIIKSLNIVAARTLMTKVGIENSYNYLVNLGVSTKAINADGVGLALGTSGITVIEMAGAYGCIANGGMYLEPLSFSRVVDSEGNFILDAQKVRESRQVYKPSSAFMLVDALTNAVNSGTGWRAKISGITTAGKTGTNHGNRGVFFAGMTGYYTSTIWIGHDEYKSLPSAYGGDTAAPIWKTYMTQIHEGLENKSILEGSASSYGVTRKTVCAVSGKWPHEGCPTVSDYFPKNGGPSGSCDMHVSATICSISGELAGMYCPADVLTTGSGVYIPKDSPYARLSQERLLAIFPNLLTGVSSGSIEGGGDATTRICSYHTYEWAIAQEQANNAKAEAQTALEAATQFLNQYQSLLTGEQIANLNNTMNALRSKMNASEPVAADIIAATNTLNNLVKTLQDYVDNLPPEPDPILPPEPDPDPEESSGVHPGH